MHNIKSAIFKAETLKNIIKANDSRKFIINSTDKNDEHLINLIKKFNSIIGINKINIFKYFIEMKRKFFYIESIDKFLRLNDFKGSIGHPLNDSFSCHLVIEQSSTFIENSIQRIRN